MIDLKHELGVEHPMTLAQINKALYGASMFNIINNILLKIQEFDLALRKIPELDDTHLTSLRELIGEMVHSKECLTAEDK